MTTYRYHYALNDPITNIDEDGLSGLNSILQQVACAGQRVGVSGLFTITSVAINASKIAANAMENIVEKNAIADQLQGNDPGKKNQKPGAVPVVVGVAGSGTAVEVVSGAAVALPAVTVGGGAYLGWKYGKTHADEIEDIVNRIARWFNFGQAPSVESPSVTKPVSIPTTTTDPSPPDETQYRLIATREGLYPKLQWGDVGDFYRKGVVPKWGTLHKGDTWKIGTSKGERYSKSWLKKYGLERVDEYTGSPQAVYMVQIMKLAQHFLVNGELPYGNTKMQ